MDRICLSLAVCLGLFGCILKTQSADIPEWYQQLNVDPDESLTYTCAVPKPGLDPEVIMEYCHLSAHEFGATLGEFIEVVTDTSDEGRYFYRFRLAEVE